MAQVPHSGLVIPFGTHSRGVVPSTFTWCIVQLPLLMADFPGGKLICTCLVDQDQLLAPCCFVRSSPMIPQERYISQTKPHLTKGRGNLG